MFSRCFGPQLARRTDHLPANHRACFWQRLGNSQEPTVVGPDVRDARLARVEAVLFTAEEPIAARRLATLAELRDVADARRLVDRLSELLSAEGSAFRVEDIAGGYQLLTRLEFHPWLVRLRQSTGEPKLTGALLETLAIVAYRQPIMRADLESVRGVHCGDALRQLMERGLIRIAGRHDSLGRPVLYGTTKRFLATFGLRDLRDLPPAG
jgi:segregation and condensation protein B